MNSHLHYMGLAIKPPKLLRYCFIAGIFLSIPSFSHAKAGNNLDQESQQISGEEMQTSQQSAIKFAKNPVNTEVLGLDPSGTWLFSRRKGDPFAIVLKDPQDPSSQVLKSYYFKQKKIALSSGINPNASRQVDEMENTDASFNRARMQSVSRLREFPLEQWGGIIDLTNEYRSHNPQVNDQSLFFKPSNHTESKRLASDSTVYWESTGFRPNKTDLTVSFNGTLPWEDKPGTLLHYAKQKCLEDKFEQSAEDFGFIFIDENAEPKLGGEYKYLAIHDALSVVPILEDLNKQKKQINESIDLIEKRIKNLFLGLISDGQIKQIASKTTRYYKQQLKELEPYYYYYEKEYSAGTTKFCWKRKTGVVLDLKKVVRNQGLKQSIPDLQESEKDAAKAEVQAAMDFILAFTNSFLTLSDKNNKTVQKAMDKLDDAAKENMGGTPDPDIDRKGLVIAYQSKGKVPLIIRQASLLTGPIQIVSDSPVIVVGSMGDATQYSPYIQKLIKKYYPWAHLNNNTSADTINKTRWRIMAPDFAIGSPLDYPKICDEGPDAADDEDESLPDDILWDEAQAYNDNVNNYLNPRIKAYKPILSYMNGSNPKVSDNFKDFKPALDAAEKYDNNMSQTDKDALSDADKEYYKQANHIRDLWKENETKSKTDATHNTPPLPEHKSDADKMLQMWEKQKADAIQKAKKNYDLLGVPYDNEGNAL